ncbi:sulfite exporter TauE/SafE family protein [Paucibacter sp. hw1]|uniref:Sulfite exporter TauE/SafE family protein n=1 Tax=Roseateles koreensis TaxID=2987526 RepID=A0ABT5KN65_9BURK|nr:sulfite exporter TauE/SafE family protein [Roseateles koreensis]
MDAALAGSALLMGLAGVPHCLAMCGAACAGLTASAGASRAAMWGFQAGRLISYAVAGGLAAGSVNVLAQLGQTSALLRPVWVLLHAAALMLGFFLLWRGRQPAWLEQLGQQVSRRVVRAAADGAAPVAVLSAEGLRGGGTSWSVPGRATIGGLAWVAWPCGLLQSALLVAALASGPVQGGLVMASFALPSGLGLALGSSVLLRLQQSGGAFSGARAMQWSVRLSGLGLASASAWALGHGVWEQVAAFCR